MNTMAKTGWGMTAAFVLVVMGIGVTIGTTVTPGTWYEGLEKPWFTPPNAAFGPVWTVLYILIGIAGARVFQRDGQKGLWLAQMALNFLWTPVFFGLHLTVAGLVIILGMLGTILAFIARSWHEDRVSALLFVPYAMWVCTAAALNAGIVWLN